MVAARPVVVGKTSCDADTILYVNVAKNGRLVSRRDGVKRRHREEKDGGYSVLGEGPNASAGGGVQEKRRTMPKPPAFIIHAQHAAETFFEVRRGIILTARLQARKLSRFVDTSLPRGREARNLTSKNVEGHHLDIEAIY